MKTHCPPADSVGGGPCYSGATRSKVPPHAAWGRHTGPSHRLPPSLLAPALALPISAPFTPPSAQCTPPCPPPWEWPLWGTPLAVMLTIGPPDLRAGPRPRSAPSPEAPASPPPLDTSPCHNGGVIAIRSQAPESECSDPACLAPSLRLFGRHQPVPHCRWACQVPPRSGPPTWAPFSHWAEPEKTPC